jgi:hypothetical protein
MLLCGVLQVNVRNADDDAVDICSVQFVTTERLTSALDHMTEPSARSSVRHATANRRAQG